MPQKATTEEIVAAYRETGSVWRAGKQLGMAGQSIHERLVSVGYPMRGRRWTADEVAEMEALAAEGVPLGEIARRLGRPFGSSAVKASEIGLRFRRNGTPRALPRGAGFDKVSMTGHMRALEVYAGSVTQFARANGLHVDPFVKACQRHFPERWRVYVEQRSDIPARECEYCGESFVPASAKQRFHDRRCADHARRDAAYFGGRRREALGLLDGTCQVCGQQKSKGMSAHHVLGKENDPENEVMVALCMGCHNLVGLLGGRKFVEDPAVWEALISLAWTRKHGAAMPDGHAINVYVEITTGPEDEL